MLLRALNVKYELISDMGGSGTGNSLLNPSLKLAFGLPKNITEPTRQPPLQVVNHSFSASITSWRRRRLGCWCWLGSLKRSRWSAKNVIQSLLFLSRAGRLTTWLQNRLRSWTACSGTSSRYSFTWSEERGVGKPSVTRPTRICEHVDSPWFFSYNKVIKLLEFSKR
jgi:hypothetical protein